MSRWRMLAGSMVVGLTLTACPQAEDPTDEATPPPTPQPGPTPATPTPEATPVEEALGEGDAFNLMAMAHTAPETLRGFEVPFETTSWDGTSDGTFSYGSIACHDDAPINNISSNLPSFNARIQGSRSPVSTRLHPIEFDASFDDQDTGEMDGRVTVVVCHLRPGVTPEPGAHPPVPPDEDKDRIEIEFSARFERTSPNEIRYQGPFEIAGGTGRYEELTGQGVIGGYVMCLGPDPCQAIGEFRDIQVVMVGNYQVPQEAIEQPPGEEEVVEDAEE